MVAGSILPVTIHQDNLLFLFGKECALEDSAKGWSDFGGGCEDCTDADTDAVRARKVLQTAVREGAEESTGFLGTPAHIYDTLLRANGGASSRPSSNRNKTKRSTISTKQTRRRPILPATLQSITHNTYTLFFMPIKHDPNLPVYYNRFHHLLWNKMDRKVLNETKLFEKSKMAWFSIAQMRKQRNQFRSFYREIVDLILEKADRPDFQKFVARNVS